MSGTLNVAAPVAYEFPAASISPEDCRRMEDVRIEIDRLDRILVELIAERTRYIEAAGRIKEAAEDVRLEWRIEDVVSKVIASAEDADLPAAIAEPVWRLLIDRSIAHEFEVWRAVRGCGPEEEGSS